MLKTLFVLVLVFLSGDRFPVGQQKQTATIAQVSSLMRWEGRWSGEGKFFGQAAVHHAQWERVLDGKFTRLSMRVETPGGQAMFEGHAYYRQTDGLQFEARWFDSQNHIYQIKAQLEADTLTAFWGEPAKEEGRSVYKLLDGGKQLEVVDSVRTKDGSWKEFGRFVLKRAAI